MTLEELNAWVKVPENIDHENFPEVYRSTLEIKDLLKLKHNHTSLEGFKEFLETKSFIGKAEVIGKIANKLHKKEGNKWGVPRDYSLEELYTQWVQDHKENPPPGFNKNGQCATDDLIDTHIEEKIKQAELWIS